MPEAPRTCASRSRSWRERIRHEHRALERDLGFTREEFDRVNDVAAAHSFLPHETRQRVWPRPIAMLW